MTAVLCRLCLTIMVHHVARPTHELFLLNFYYKAVSGEHGAMKHFHSELLILFLNLQEKTTLKIIAKRAPYIYRSQILCILHAKCGGEEGQTECTIRDSKIENGQCIGLLNVFTVAVFSKISNFRAVTKAMFTPHCIPDRFCAGTKAILDKASVCKHIII